MTSYDRFLSQAARLMKGSAIRKMGTLLATRADIISFAPGYPSADTFEWLDLAAIAERVLARHAPAALQYGPTRGHRALLETIAALMATRGVESPLERLLVTTGSQQGLDLAARVLVDPGDVVLVELPTYTGAITAFSNLRAELVGVPQDAGGIALDRLDETWSRLTREGRRVSFLYVVPNFQNPSGLLVDTGRRRGLLEWAARRDVLILEDDPYGDLYFDAEAGTRVRPLRADDAERVIYLSTFSKTLAPGLRVAWVDAPPALAGRLELAKQASDLSAGTLDQQIVLEACRRGTLDRQLPRLRAHYAAKRDAMHAALTGSLGDVLSWTLPRGGFFVWARLPGPIDADALLLRAVEHAVIYVAGTAFHVDGGGQHFMRLSFASPEVAQIPEGVARLAAAIREALAAAA